MEKGGEKLPMNLALIRLLHLASPTLPVGAYTYSQGLEWAVESGAVRDEKSALAWIGDCLEHGIARFEAVYLAQMMLAWRMYAEENGDKVPPAWGTGDATSQGLESGAVYPIWQLRRRRPGTPVARCYHTVLSCGGCRYRPRHDDYRG